MFNRILILLFPAIAMLAVVSQASAALVFGVESITFSSPITSSQDFSLAVTAKASGQDEFLANYQLPFDVDPNGSGLPTGLTLLGATRAGGTSQLFSSSDLVADDDLVVTDLNASKNILDGTSETLFTLDFRIEPGIAPGVYAVDLNELNGGFYLVNGPSSVGTPSDGAITVAAIPEPNSLVFLTLFGGGVFLRRPRSPRRR